jgi:hypothetical protein
MRKEINIVLLPLGGDENNMRRTEIVRVVVSQSCRTKMAQFLCRRLSQIDRARSPGFGAQANGRPAGRRVDPVHDEFGL